MLLKAIKNWLPFLLLWGILIAYYVPKIDDIIPPRNDDCLYLMLAKSFWEGKAYRNLAAPDVPDFIVVPSAFPLLLAPGWAGGTFPIYWAKLGLTLLFSLAVVFTTLWLRSRMELATALLVGLAIGLSPSMAFLHNSFLSETVFIFLLSLSFLLRDRIAKSNQENLAFGILYALILVVLARTRIVGLPIAIVLLIEQLKNHRWKNVLTASTLLLVWLVAEHFGSHNLPAGEGGYLRNDILARYPFVTEPIFALVNLSKHVILTVRDFFGTVLIDFLWPFFYGMHPMDKIKRVVVLLISLSVVLGFVKAWKRFPKDRFLYLAVILSLLPLFSQRSGAFYRYLLPFLPILFFWQLQIIKPGWPWIRLGLVILFAFNQIVATISGKGIDPFLKDQLSFEIFHEKIAALPKPQVLLSPQNFYSYLLTENRTLIFRPGSIYLPRPKYLKTSDTCIYLISKLDDPIASGNTRVEKVSREEEDDVRSDWLGESYILGLDTLNAGPPLLKSGPWRLWRAGAGLRPYLEKQTKVIFPSGK